MIVPAQIQPAPTQSPSSSSGRRRIVFPTWAMRLLTWLVVAAFSLLALDGGLVLRGSMWPASRDVLRFYGDIGNAWAKGGDVLHYAHDEADKRREPNDKLTWRQFFRGYLGVYDRVDADAGPAPADGSYKQYSLDYPPGRLLIMSLWVWHAKTLHPDIGDWRDDVCQPLLALNTICELLAAIAAFLLVWLWIRRSAGGSGSTAPGTTVATTATTAPGATTASASESQAADEINAWGFCDGWLSATVALAAIFFSLRVIWQGGGLPDAMVLTKLAVLMIVAIGSVRVMATPHRAWFAGLLAALLLWFNPPMLLESHTWPQWDCWVLPAFLGAALLISLNFGFTAGLILTAGVFMKGQTLFAVPILFLWPLLGGRWETALRFLLGMALAGAVLAGGWLAPSPTAWIWIGEVFAAGVIAAGVAAFAGPLRRHAVGLGHHFSARAKARRRIIRRRKKAIAEGKPSPRRLHLSNPVPSSAHVVLAQEFMPTPIGSSADASAPPAPSPRRARLSRVAVYSLIVATLLLTLAGALVVAGMPRGGWTAALAAAFVAGVLIPPWILPRRWIGVWLATVVAAAIFQAGVSFNGSFNWFFIGLAYGEHHFPMMHVGPTHNFSAVLADVYGWSLDRTPANLVSLPAPWSNAPATFYVKPMLVGIYFLCVLIAAAGAAIHGRRKDPRVLVALTAPWVCMFTILPQMHERYAMYGSAVAALGVAAGSGEALLYIPLAFVAVQPMLEVQLSNHPQAIPGLMQFVQNTDPGLGWMLLLLSGIYLWLAIAPRRATEPMGSS